MNEPNKFFMPCTHQRVEKITIQCSFHYLNIRIKLTSMINLIKKNRTRSIHIFEDCSKHVIAKRNPVIVIINHTLKDQDMKQN